MSTSKLGRAARLAVHSSNTTAAAATLRALGDTHKTSGSSGGAASAYAAALSIEPDDCVTSAKLADVHSSRGDATASVAALRAALAEDHACPLAHHGLARMLTKTDAPLALRHARAALELRPFDDEYEATLKRVLKAQPKGGALADGGEQRRVQPEDTAAGEGAACGAGDSWQSPIAPSELEPATGCTAQHRRLNLLLVNPFEEGCFHDDLRTNVRQQYHSCGQFNNVLASLLQALALSKILCRTLILPGFYVRFGRRLTRVSPFEERWLPTSHFVNLTTLRAAFDVIEMREWLPAGQARELPFLQARAIGNSAPQLRFFSHHNVTFRHPLKATFPHLLQQQSELRWVEDDTKRDAYFSRFEHGYGAAFWRRHFGEPVGGGAAEVAAHAHSHRVLAFDTPVSLGLQLDHLRWGESLLHARGHVRYVGAVFAEAAKVRRALFGSSDAPYLSVHIRRGADRLHDFCHTGWGKRCFGWNITMDMCYPSTEEVARQILDAKARWSIPDGHIFLATDSPRPELFEDVLRDTYGVRFARYGQDGPGPSLGEEYELPVDQVLCASAPYFLGNVPSTVTATIVQERDAMGWDRERTAFFGFTDENTRQFRDGWEASTAFSAHYADGGAPSASGCGRIAE